MFGLKHILAGLVVIPFCLATGEAQVRKMPVKSDGPTVEVGKTGPMTELEVEQLLRTIDPGMKKVRYAAFSRDSYEVKCQRGSQFFFVLVTVEDSGIYLDAILGTGPVREDSISHSVLVDLLLENGKISPNYFVIDSTPAGLRLRMSRALPREVSAEYLRGALGLMTANGLDTVALWRHFDPVR
jgi:hypothetical protein